MLFDIVEIGVTVLSLVPSAYGRDYPLTDFNSPPDFFGGFHQELESVTHSLNWLRRAKGSRNSQAINVCGCHSVNLFNSPTVNVCGCIVVKVVQVVFKTMIADAIRNWLRRAKGSRNS